MADIHFSVVVEKDGAGSERVPVGARRKYKRAALAKAAWIEH
jgi:hypothetical protein